MRYCYESLSEYLKGNHTRTQIKEFLQKFGWNPILTSDEAGTYFTLEVPANRGDLFSLLGLAKALVPAGNFSVESPSFSVQEKSDRTISVKVENVDDCPLYSGRIVEGIMPAPSPAWLSSAVERAGFRSINNVVDVTNLVFVEYGQPLHAFDLSKVKEGIVVRRARASETITTLDGVNRTLGEEVLLIADTLTPIGIAGIMGGADSEITSATQAIFLESASFHPVRIRKGARFLGHSTEASQRFEKSVDLTLVIEALDRAAFLMETVCGGRVGPRIVRGSRIEKEKKIRLDTRRVSHFLGCDIPSSFLIDLFEKLRFSVSGKNILTVTVPPGRTDLEREEDLIEEVARYYGYDAIPETLPCAEISSTVSSSFYEKEEKVKDFSVRTGFTEVSNLGLVSKDEAHFFGGTGPEIINPLSLNFAFLRGSLLPELLRNLKENFSYRTERLSLFETGKYFFSDYTERLGLALAAMNEGDFYTFKGRVESILSFLEAKDLRWDREDISEGVSIPFSSSGELLGSIYIPSPDFLQQFDLENESIFLCQIDLEKIFAIPSVSSRCEPLSTLPLIRRDLSLIIPKKVRWHEVEETLYSSLLPSGLSEIRVCDIYEGKHIPEDSTGATVSFSFQNDGSLTREGVDALLHTTLATLDNLFSIRIRE
ncbi:MAG: phenylalanine--tRNA ligase subunit beta [Candidatus Ratteibacteria bacterium]|jgi:phenylalanyl-tRNA synthetase beta chain